MQSGSYLTAAFYKFVELTDYAERREPLLLLCNKLGIRGLILLAREGINSTIAGEPDAVRLLLAHLRADPLLADLQHKESWANKAPFRRMKVKLKKEIVTLGVAGVSPTKMVGQYVNPQDWNALISDPNVLVIDTRNDYEVELGSFKGAINPNIETFSALPGWLDSTTLLNNRSKKTTKVAMFCTGGIRCEKSTALLKEKGYEQVYHLEGGILKYLEHITPEQSLWEGACFVFDERVSVEHGLKLGPHQLCRCCRQPVSEIATASPKFELGVSCLRCFEKTTDEQKQSARERQRQCELAEQRQETHVGQSTTLS